MPRPLVVKLTCGPEDAERCNQAFTVAAAAATAGVGVSLWATGDAVALLSREGCVDLALPHATPLPELVELLLATAQVTACTQCVQRRGLTAHDLLPGVRIAGAALFVEEVVADDVQALVY